MAALAEFIARAIAAPVRLAGRLADPAGRIAVRLRELAPYAAIELILPGGSLLALLLWLYRRYYLTVAAPALHATSSCDPVPPEQPIAPMSFPLSTSGIPPRVAITPSSVR